MASSAATRVYLAGPLFIQAERQWNTTLANSLSQNGFDLLVPQVLAERYISAHGGFDPATLFRLAADSVKSADVVLAVLDDPDPDSGTVFECAIAWSHGIPVVGLRTDFRKGGDGVGNVNLMLSASCREVVHVDALMHPTIQEVVERVVPALLRSAGAPMPLPARPHPDTLAGTEPNRILHEVVTAGANNDDPLPQFLPEAPGEAIVTESLLRDPLGHESQCEPQDPLLDQTRNVSANVARVRTVFRRIAPPRTRPRLRRRLRTRSVLRSLRRRVRRTCAVARLARGYCACLIKRTAAIGTSGAWRFKRFSGDVTTRGRAAWRFCSVVAVLVRARLTKRIRTIESVISMVGRHLRAISRSRHERRSLGPLRTLVRFAHRFALSRQSLGMRIPAWVVETSKVHAQGMNVSLVSFTCGTAVGALVMWLFGVQPALHVATPRNQTAPAETTASILRVPASARDVSVSRESAPAGPTVSAPSIVPAVPTQIATSGRSARDRSPAVARPQAAANPPAVSRPAAVARLIPFLGSLAVDSEPRGARVFINGQSVGSTLLVVKGVPVGSRAVRIEAEGYHTWSAAVQVIANQQTQVTARLDRVIARLDQTSRP